jgi:hypothetical protein
MSIKQLVALIAPPTAPVDNEGNWRAAEIVVGAEYPADFRDLITLYGTGTFFQGHLKVYNPLTVGGLACIKEDEDTCRSNQEDVYSCPLPIHPDAPGLLPWGRDENGDGYFWLTEGKPEKWPVVVLRHGREDRPLQFRVDITGFATDKFKKLVTPGAPMTEAMRVFRPGRSQVEDARLAAEASKRRKGRAEPLSWPTDLNKNELPGTS